MVDCSSVIKYYWHLEYHHRWWIQSFSVPYKLHFIIYSVSNSQTRMTCTILVFTSAVSLTSECSSRRNPIQMLCYIANTIMYHACYLNNFSNKQDFHSKLINYQTLLHVYIIAPQSPIGRHFKIKYQASSKYLLYS